MKTQTLVNLAPQPPANTPQTWDQPTPLAQVGDIIRQSFAPVMQVIEKDVLADGRVRLLVKPVSASYTEEWVVEPPIVEQQPTPIPAADIEASQPVGLAGDVTIYQLQPDWEALAEYESGIAHGQLDAANRMPPICAEASCPYSQGYLDAYRTHLGSNYVLSA